MFRGILIALLLVGCESSCEADCDDQYDECKNEREEATCKMEWRQCQNGCGDDRSESEDESSGEN